MKEHLQNFSLTFLFLIYIKSSTLISLLFNFFPAVSRLKTTGGSWCHCGIKQELKQIKCVWTGLRVRASPLDSAEVRAALTPLGLYSFALFKWLPQTWTS